MEVKIFCCGLSTEHARADTLACPQHNCHGNGEDLPWLVSVVFCCRLDSLTVMRIAVFPPDQKSAI